MTDASELAFEIRLMWSDEDIEMFEELTEEGYGDELVKAAVSGDKDYNSLDQLRAIVDHHDVEDLRSDSDPSEVEVPEEERRKMKRRDRGETGATHRFAAYLRNEHGFGEMTVPGDLDVLTLDLAEIRDWDEQYEETDPADPNLADMIADNPDSMIDDVLGVFRVDAARDDVHSRSFAVEIIGTEAESWRVGESPRDWVGSVVTVDTTVTARKGRTTVRPSNMFECQRCGFRTERYTTDTWESEGPIHCSGCEKQGPFDVVEDESPDWDYRELEIEELPDTAEIDGDPESIRGEVIRQPIVDGMTASAGERVRLTGILRTESIEVDRKEIPHYLDIRHCEPLDRDATVGDITDEDRDIIEQIRDDPERSLLDEMMRTVHPTVHREDALRAGLLSVVGAPDDEQSGSRVRGDIHLLMIGDPGAGKSTAVDALTSVTPKYGKTAGGTSSSVGLTASASQDGIGMGDNGWVLKPGMLPRSHGGSLFINEFDDIDPSDRRALNEALESGEVEVSKAGMHARFPAEASVVATANPKYGSFREGTEEPLAQQVQFSDPLKSRFDLIFPFRNDHTWDQDVTMAQNLLGDDTDSAVADGGSPDADLSVDLVRRWIAHVRDTVDPVLTDDDLVNKISNAYARIGQYGSGRGIPIDPRTIRTLERLSKAHARLRASDEVEEEDVDVAISLLDSSLEQLGVLSPNDRSDDVMDLSRAAAEASLSSGPSQKERREAIVDAVESMVDTSVDGVYRAVSEEYDVDRDTIEDEIDSLCDDGTLVLDGDGEAEVFR